METPPRRRILGVSTKMYFTAARTKAYVSAVLVNLSEMPNLLSQLDVFLIPDHVTLAGAIDLAQAARSPVLIGAQDCFSEDTGAYTGAVSPAVLAEVGVRIVEVGHAERRRLFGENDPTTAAKAAAVARHGMLPLVCIGEKEAGAVGAAADEVLQQVETVLAALPADADVVLAYEPVWAIGAAEPAAVDHVVGVVGRIREAATVKRRTGRTRIVYGGSAGPGLFGKLKGAVDGLFLGRFAHDPDVFCQTVREVAEA